MRWLRWLIAEIQFRRFLRSVPWEPVVPENPADWEVEVRDGVHVMRRKEGR